MDDGAAITQAIDQLLDATPEPPPLDADPAEVMTTADLMLRQRAPLCSALLGLPADHRAVPGSHADRYAMLLSRNERWTACLSHARHVIRERMDGSRRSRNSYQP